MDETQSYLVYNPPKSNSHGHGVRLKNVKQATQKVIDSFVGAFKASTDNKLQLTLHYDKNTELEKAQKTSDKLKEYLGLPESEWDNPGYEYMDNSINWETEDKAILDVIDYVVKLKDDSYLPLHKYWISCFYHYGVNPEPYGHIRLSIESGRLFVRLRLITPHTMDNPDCYTLLSEFQRSLPFKLNPKHFRRLGPSKRGYGTWKLDEETQNRIAACLG